MGIRVFPTTGSGRARCQTCDNLIEKEGICVFAQSTGVPSSAACSGYVCWACFTSQLPKNADKKTIERLKKKVKEHEETIRALMDMMKEGRNI